MQVECKQYKQIKKSEASLSKKIVRNTLYTGMGRFWVMTVNFILTPYIVSKIGIEKFGIWVLAYAIIGFLSLIDFGTGNACLKYISEYYAKKEYNRINEIISTGLMINIIVGLLISMSLFLRYPIIDLFKFDPAYYDDVIFVLTLAIIFFAISFICSIFKSVIDGLQRMDITNKINIAVSIVNVIGVVIFLELGYGLKGLIINSGILVVLTISLNACFAYRLLPSLKINPKLIRLKRFKEVLKYGIKVHVSKIAVFINQQLDKVLLGHFVGIATVGFYGVGARLSRLSRQVPMVLFPAIMPAASELDSVKDQKRLHALYMRGSRYLSSIVMPLFLFGFTISYILVNLWMGRGYDTAVMVVRFLIVGFSVNVLTGIGTSIVRGVGRPEIETRYTILVAISNAILSIILIIKMGLIGALIGTSVSLVVFSIYFMLVFHKEIINESYIEFVKKIYYKPFFISLILCMIIGALNLALERFFNLQNRLDYLAVLLLDIIVFGPLYFYFLFKTKYLEVNELKKLLKIAAQK